MRLHWTAAALSAPLANADELDRFGEAMVETIEAEPSDVRLFGEPRIVRGLDRASRELWMPFVICFAITISLLVWERRRRRRRAPGRQNDGIGDDPSGSDMTR